MTRTSESSEIRANVTHVWESIQRAAHRAGRDPNTITLVAATKMVPPERMLEAYESQVGIFGENRLQEAQRKMDAIQSKPDLSWHFIGRVQRRKIKAVIGRFDLIHSVEDVEQALEMDRRAEESGVQQAVLLEVNAGDESTKGGFSVAQVMAALPELDRLRHLFIKGLMVIPPFSENPEDSRPYFRELRDLAEAITRSSCERIRMDELSMGMSQDYPIAVEEGATIVRVGTAIFGQRNQ